MKQDWIVEPSQSGSGPIFVENWAPEYGSPYLTPSEEDGEIRGELLEDGEELRIHAAALLSDSVTLAFVDGVRRVEASLYKQMLDGMTARGLAGALAFGAVLAADGERPSFLDCEARRLLVWGSGAEGRLPPVAGGWSWLMTSTTDVAPDAPLRHLQNKMREEEGALAERLCETGRLVVIDGPLNFVRQREAPVVGYIKTHHRTLLSAEDHQRVPLLGPGERTSLFTLGDRLSCYLRLVLAGVMSGPWSGIVRLEIPGSVGLREATRVASLMAGALPRFASESQRDPRAPQNLQPIGALETHLRHLLGDRGLANRAVRTAAASVSGAGRATV